MKSLVSALILFLTMSVTVQAAGKPRLTNSRMVSRVVSDQIIDGQFGPGALYRLVRPANWNGRLFLYAHGFVSRSEPVTLPPEALFDPSRAWKPSTFTTSPTFMTSL